MKTFSKLLLVFFSLVVCGAEAISAPPINQAQRELMFVVDEMQAVCPYDMGTLGNLTTVRYDTNGNTVNAYVSVTDMMQSMLNNISDTQALKRTIGLGMKAQPDFLNILAKANASISYTYLFPDNHRMTISFTQAEIRTLASGAGDDASTLREYAQSLVASSNSMCPVLVDVGIILKRVVIVGDYIIYVNNADTSTYTIESLKSCKDILYNAVTQRIVDDPTDNAEVNIYAKAGYGIAYRYYVDDNYVDLVVLPNSRLRELLGL